MRVAIAHDWMTTYGGSERVVEEMLQVFPSARLLAAVVDFEVVPTALRRAEPSYLQRLPAATRYHRWLLPLMPSAWRLRRPISDVDAVVSSSHACANAVRIAPGIPHLCYSHTPMRYAWHFDAERGRVPSAVRPLAEAAMGWFRRWDVRTAARVTRFLANSTAVAARIARAYGRAADVIHPPVRTDFFTPDGERDDAFLLVGRLVSYKRPDLAVEAFAGLPHRLIVVGDGAMEGRLRAAAHANVEFRGSVNDDELRTLYRRARALVFPGEEDFGIVMAEAQACGTPVIALARGGAVDIVEHGVTGWLLPDARAETLARAVRRAVDETLDPAEIRRRAERFSHLRFRREIGAVVEETVASYRSNG